MVSYSTNQEMKLATQQIPIKKVTEDEEENTREQKYQIKNGILYRRFKNKLLLALSVAMNWRNNMEYLSLEESLGKKKIFFGSIEPKTIFGDIFDYPICNSTIKLLCSE